MATQRIEARLTELEALINRIEAGMNDQFAVTRKDMAVLKELVASNSSLAETESVASKKGGVKTRKTTTNEWPQHLRGVKYYYRHLMAADAKFRAAHPLNASESEEKYVKRLESKAWNDYNNLQQADKDHYKTLYEAARENYKKGNGGTLAPAPVMNGVAKPVRRPVPDLDELDGDEEVVFG